MTAGALAATRRRFVGSPIFVGDFSTGNFSQWNNVQNINYNDSGSGYTPSYPATIITDGTKGLTARFEVRQGDDFGIGERSEIGSFGQGTAGSSGQVRWYKFSVKFDATFYTPGGGSDWSVTNQWHALPNGINPDVGSHLAFGTDGWNYPGEWQLNIKTYSGENFAIWRQVLDRGNWHDMKVEIGWSTGSTGYVRLWRNGVSQTLLDNGSGSTDGTTWTGRTMQVGGTGGYYKCGLYRLTRSQTGIIYHTGFKCAATEADLG